MIRRSTASSANTRQKRLDSATGAARLTASDSRDLAGVQRPEHAHRRADRRVVDEADVLGALRRQLREGRCQRVIDARRGPRGRIRRIGNWVRPAVRRSRARCRARRSRVRAAHVRQRFAQAPRYAGDDGRAHFSALVPRCRDKQKAGQHAPPPRARSRRTACRDRSTADSPAARDEHREVSVEIECEQDDIRSRPAPARTGTAAPAPAAAPRARPGRRTGANERSTSAARAVPYST